MAVETITLGTLTQQVLLVVANHSNTTADATLTSQVRWALHAALRDYVSITESQAFRTDATIALVSGTKDYALADDFMQMLDPSPHFIASDFRTLQYLTEQDFRAFEYERSQQTGDPTHYTLRNRSASDGSAQIRFWPTPNAARTVRYHYVAIPGKLYDGSDATVIDKRLPPYQHHVLVWGAVTYMPRYLNVAGDLQQYALRWQEALGVGRSKSPPVAGQAYQRIPYMGAGGIRSVIPTITQAAQ